MAMNNILGLFAHSPLKPLQKHSDKVTECCDLLIPFFQHTFLKQWDDAEKTRLDISQCEREADSLKREIRLKLPRGLFLPIDRTDLLELVTQQDKLANYAKDILKNKQTLQNIIDRAVEEKLAGWLKEQVELDTKEVTADEFNKLFEE